CTVASPPKVRTRADIKRGRSHGQGHARQGTRRPPQGAGRRLCRGGAKQRRSFQPAAAGCAQRILLGRDLGARGPAAQDPQHAQSRDHQHPQPSARVARAFARRIAQRGHQGGDHRDLPAGRLLCGRSRRGGLVPHRARVLQGNRRPDALRTWTMDIGFIGLGNMGFPMVRRLIEAGHTVIALDLRKDVMDRAVALGAKAAASPKEVGDRAETVMASLPTPDVVLAGGGRAGGGVGGPPGGGGVIEGQRVRRFVDLSTTGSVMAARISEALRARSIVQVDAPVSGGVAGAEKGTLAVMTAGPKADVDAVEPALAVIGKVFYLGDRPGAGQTMKLANNFLSATAMAATSEAMVMGVKAGLDPRVMLDVINAG